MQDCSFAAAPAVLRQHTDRVETAGGTAFIALVDEGGVVNAILRLEVFTAYRKVLRGRFVVIKGTLQWQGRVYSVVGERMLAVEG